MFLSVESTDVCFRVCFLSGGLILGDCADAGDRADRAVDAGLRIKEKEGEWRKKVVGDS